MANEQDVSKINFFAEVGSTDATEAVTKINAFVMAGAMAGVIEVSKINGSVMVSTIPPPPRRRHLARTKLIPFG